jgi:hypothetical protein
MLRGEKLRDWEGDTVRMLWTAEFDVAVSGNAAITDRMLPLPVAPEKEV